MEGFLRVPRVHAADAVPIEFDLMRPYFDLGTAPIEPPSQVLGIELAAASVADPEAPRLPIQNRPGVALRDRLTAVPGLARYAVDDPARLPRELRTPRWQNLCDHLESFPRLAPAVQSAVTSLLSSLGFYRPLAELGEHLSPDDPHSLVALVRVAHARASLDRTPHSRTLSITALETVESRGDMSAQARLNAATTLVVLHARGDLASMEKVTRYCRRAEAHLRRLRPDDDWVDALAASTYWRAVSFEPYLAGDVERTREHLDLAERYARALPEATETQRRLRLINFHPLLETRSITEVWAGNLDGAVRYAAEFVEADPMDGKAHIRLGDLYLRRGESRAALRCYLCAAALGAPYASLGWYKAARAVGAAPFDRLALACAHQVDPAAVTPLAETLKLAGPAGEAVLSEWAAHEIKTLRVGRQLREASCEQSS